MVVKEHEELRIFKKDKFCGLLRRSADGGAEFIYDENYLLDQKNKDLSFNLKKRPQPYIQQGANLHPYFAGLLPEGLRLKFLLNRVKTSPDDLFSLFAAIGNDCVGDVYAQDSKDRIAGQIKQLPDWNQISFYEYFLSVQASEKYIERGEYSGVQEKISASMISLPLSFKNKGSFILKLNPKDKPNLVYNEWACLYLAELCKIEVNKFNLIEDRDGDLGLLVQRFDRVQVDGAETRCHQEDLCQVLNVFPAEKYRIPMRDIFNGVIKYSTAPFVETYKLLKLIVFSYLIGNGDLHAKNISLVESPIDGQVSLSPAYDLICTLLYGDQYMALKLDAKNSNFKRSDFITFGARFGLSEKAIESLIDNLLIDFYRHHHILFSIDAPENKTNHLANEFLKRMDTLS